jgi:hypothetical protein
MVTETAAANSKRVEVSIKAPHLETAVFEIVGNAPLVVHRFSAKAKAAMLAKMEAGSTAKKGKAREKFDVQAAFDGARYRAKAGWDGFNASAIRAAMRCITSLGVESTSRLMKLNRTPLTPARSSDLRSSSVKLSSTKATPLARPFELSSASTSARLSVS